MQNLTARQDQVLHAVRDYHAAHGYAPTVRELCALLGCRSTQTVQKHLNTLQRKGRLTRAGSRCRTLRVVAPVGEDGRE